MNIRSNSVNIQTYNQNMWVAEKLVQALQRIEKTEKRSAAPDWKFLSALAQVHCSFRRAADELSPVSDRDELVRELRTLQTKTRALDEWVNVHGFHFENLLDAIVGYAYAAEVEL